MSENTATGSRVMDIRSFFKVQCIFGRGGGGSGGGGSGGGSGSMGT